MSVSCECDVYDSEWYYEHKGDFSPLATRRRQRCWSCRELISLGSDCGVCERYREPRSDIEESIYGDRVWLASAYLCEECYGLMLSVEEVGGCVQLQKGELLKDAVLEWRQEYPDGCR